MSNKKTLTPFTIKRNYFNDIGAKYMRWLICFVLGVYGSYSLTLTNQQELGDILFFTLYAFFIIQWSYIILTYLNYSIFPIYHELPNGSGSSTLNIVRNSSGELYIQAFGQREYHKLDRSSTLPFPFVTSMISLQYGKHLTKVGYAEVDFQLISWERMEIPWFQYYMHKNIGIGMKWPKYKYTINTQ